MNFKPNVPNYPPRSRGPFQTRQKEEDQLPAPRATPQSFASRRSFSSFRSAVDFFKRRDTPSISRTAARRIGARKEEFLPDVQAETEAQDRIELTTTLPNQPTQSTIVVNPTEPANQNSERFCEVLEQWKLADSNRREELEKAEIQRKALEISESEWKEDKEVGRLVDGSERDQKFESAGDIGARRSGRLSSDPTLIRSSFESSESRSRLRSSTLFERSRLKLERFRLIKYRFILLSEIDSFSRGSFFLSRLESVRALGSRSLVFGDLNTQIEAMMQDDVVVQEKYVIQALSEATVVIESQDQEDEEATSNRDKGKQVIRNQEAEQYQIVKARLRSHGSTEDSIIEEDENSDETLDGRGEVDEMVEEELREDSFRSIEQVIANGPRSSPKLRHVLPVVTEARDEGIGAQDATESPGRA